MDPIIKRRWVTRLRSGIPQGAGYLGRTDGSRCCLGVLCDLAVEEGVIPPPTPHEEGDDVLRYGEYATALLPIEVKRWAGLASSDPEVRGVSLSGWNDRGESFSTIARLIEESRL